jgi:hypothetical protein
MHKQVQANTMHVPVDSIVTIRARMYVHVEPRSIQAAGRALA